MLNESLKQFIDSFSKKPGTYEDDEIFEIGLKHKSLPQKEKDWGQLAEYLGYSNPHTLRSYVLRRQKREGININKDITSAEGISSITEDIDYKREELYKQQVKTQDVLNQYRKEMREESRFERLSQFIKESVADLEKSFPLSSYCYTKSDTPTSNEAILMISDLHLGVKCNNFYNKYDEKIAAQRLNLLADKAIQYCKKYKVAKLNIINLGDMIQGLIHTTSRMEQEMVVTDQIMKASELLATTLNKLQKAAPIVTYRSVVDNHSRAVANLSESLDGENFGKIITWYLKARLKDKKIKFENDNIDDGMGKFYLNNGQCVMFAHGHQDNSNQSFQHFMGATKEFVDYVLLAHFHAEKVKTYQALKVINNGSIVGTEQYAVSKRLFAQPSQTLLIFEDKDLINISINLETK